VIILDHNIPKDQVDILRHWGIHYKQIGFEVGRPEWDDQQEILRYLHAARLATFFTRDAGFFRARLRHSRYCLVVLDVPILHTADRIRRFLRHPDFNTRLKRSGKVVKVSTARITFWELGREGRQSLRS
jgi:hypothetical protein